MSSIGAALLIGIYLSVYLTAHEIATVSPVWFGGVFLMIPLGWLLDVKMGWDQKGGM